MTHLKHAILKLVIILLEQTQFIHSPVSFKSVALGLSSGWWDPVLKDWSRGQAPTEQWVQGRTSPTRAGHGIPAASGERTTASLQSPQPKLVPQVCKIRQVAVFPPNC